MNIKRLSLAGLALVGLFTIAAWDTGENESNGINPSMTRGIVAMGSAGPITFGPNGTLFLGDTYGGAVWAVDLEETAGADAVVEVENLDGRVASLLGASREQVRIHDLAVSPVSHAVYVTASRVDYDDDNNIKNLQRPGATPHLIRIDPDGSITEVNLSAVMFQQADIRDVRKQELDRRGNDRRAFSILEMSFVDGTLYVSGMSNEEWSSKLRRLDYPFTGESESNAIKIFHTAHGRWETGAPARVFVPYEADGETRIFAGFSCTPLVDFSVAEMNQKERVEGKTIAELGAGNHVLDMIRVEYDGKTYFLLANHLHPFMRLSLEDFDGAAKLTQPTNKAGIDRDPMNRMDGVTRLANDGDTRVVFLRESDEGVSLGVAEVVDLVG
jgi:hypothetical protein